MTYIGHLSKTGTSPGISTNFSSAPMASRTKGMGVGREGGRERREGSEGKGREEGKDGAREGGREGRRGGEGWRKEGTGRKEGRKELIMTLHNSTFCLTSLYPCRYDSEIVPMAIKDDIITVLQDEFSTRSKSGYYDVKREFKRLLEDFQQKFINE